MSNCDRFAAAPLAEGGTTVAQWAGLALPAGDLSQCPGMVIVAAHPDDETLGLGATAAQLSAAGVEVQVVSVTDGGAAYPGLSAEERSRLEACRATELACAAAVLGIPVPVRLGLPDGRLGEHEDDLADLLAAILAGRGPVWCAANWSGDGHPDHEAVGRAAAAAVERTAGVLLEYPVWAWHWARPDDPDLPWRRAAAMPTTDWAVSRKVAAARCYRSQFDSDPPLLPPFVLDRLLAVGEVVFR